MDDSLKKGLYYIYKSFKQTAISQRLSESYQMLKKLHNMATKALALEGLALPEGLCHELEIFIAQETTLLNRNSSVSVANWHNFSNQHGSKFNPPLTDDYLGSMRSLPEDNTPAYDLPLSFHKSSALNAWQWMEVYGEKGEQVKEVGTLRLLEPVCLVQLISSWTYSLSISFWFLLLHFFVAA